MSPVNYNFFTEYALCCLNTKLIQVHNITGFFLQGMFQHLFSPYHYYYNWIFHRINFLDPYKSLIQDLQA